MMLPRYFKIIGLILIIPSLILGLVFQLANYTIPFLNYHGGRRRDSMAAIGDNNMTDEIVTTALILGLIFIGFSKQKNENPAIQKLRLKALFWAVLAHGFATSILLIVFKSGIFKFGFINKYDTPVMNFILDNNLFVLLIIFVLRLYYLFYRGKKEAELYYISFRLLVLANKVITIILFTFTMLAMFDIWVIKFSDTSVLLLLPSTFLWVWSAEKSENAAIENIRLKAMLLSVIFNYSAFIMLTWTIYGINYLVVLHIFLASIPLAFIPLFYWLRFRNKQHRARISLS